MKTVVTELHGNGITVVTELQVYIICLVKPESKKVRISALRWMTSWMIIATGLSGTSLLSLESPWQDANHVLTTGTRMGGLECAWGVIDPQMKFDRGIQTLLLY